jgi:hypothetical protein
MAPTPQVEAEQVPNPSGVTTQNGADDGQSALVWQRATSPSGHGPTRQSEFVTLLAEIPAQQTVPAVGQLAPLEHRTAPIRPLGQELACATHTGASPSRQQTLDVVSQAVPPQLTVPVTGWAQAFCPSKPATHTSPFGHSASSRQSVSSVEPHGPVSHNEEPYWEPETVAQQT